MKFWVFEVFEFDQEMGTVEKKQTTAVANDQTIRQILLVSAGASHSVALLCKNSYSFFWVFFAFGFLIIS